VCFSPLLTRTFAILLGSPGSYSRSDSTHCKSAPSRCLPCVLVHDHSFCVNIDGKQVADKTQRSMYTYWPLHLPLPPRLPTCVHVRIYYYSRLPARRECPEPDPGPGALFDFEPFRPRILILWDTIGKPATERLCACSRRNTPISVVPCSWSLPVNLLI
jgi:hypothetical protein